MGTAQARRATDSRRGSRLRGARSTLRQLFAHRDDPYGDVDIENASRIGGLLWMFASLLALCLIPLDPPNDHGNAWVPAVVIMLLISFLLSNRMSKSTVPPRILLAASYIALAEIALLVWLAGGLDTAYGSFFLLCAVYTSMASPPRQGLAFLLVLSVVVAAPLAYDGWNRAEAGDTGAKLILWLGLAGVGLILIDGIRAQRSQLRAEGESARRLARVDALTGLGNRRAFDEALEKEIVRAERMSKPLSIVVADVVDFKKINDLYGHVNGDKCLRDVASTIDSEVRRPDSCFRWGGDEFVVLLPDTDFAGAALVRNRVSQAVSKNCREPGGSRLSVRAGTAELEEEMNADDFVAAADLTLMSLKLESERAEAGDTDNSELT